MRVLVTGGSGFLGSYVAEQLDSQGHTVRALVRPKSDKRVLEKLRNVEFAAGSIEDKASLAGAVKDVDAIIHAAGLVKARTPGEFFQTNAQGTRNLLEAAEAHAPGLKRFVYVSSLAAMGPSADGKPISDDAEPHPVTHYGRSKLEGERAVLAAKDRLPVTVLRPPAIYGPRDREMLAFFRSIQNGVLPVLGDGKNTLSLIYGPDCASACVLAATSDAPSGRAYFVEDGEAHVWREALADVERALGRRARLRFGLPLAVVAAAALGSELYGKIANKAVMLTRDKVNELKQSHWVCSGEGARKDLGWTPKTQWKAGVAECVQWYRKEGWL